MLVRSFDFFQILKTLTFCTITVCGVAIFLFVGSLGQFFCINMDKSKLEKPRVKQENQVVNSLDMSFLQQGNDLTSFYKDDLLKMLRVFANNTRPDASEVSNTLLIGLKNQQDRMEVAVGDKLYLSYDSLGLRFAQTPTALWMKVQEIGVGKMNFDVGMKDVASCIVSTASEMSGSSDEEREFLVFDKAKWWRPDQFYEMYGGQEYTKVKGLQRLAFEEGQEGVCLVKEGTNLIFKDKRWQVQVNHESMQGYPVAQVIALTTSRMDIKIWDVDGMQVWETSLTPEKPKLTLIKPEEVFTQIKQRGSSQISCKIGSKTVLLKAGDWLLKTEHGWKNLRTWEEIQKYLSFEIQGDLFVFDGIEKKQGNAIFKGHLFDTMRIQMQEISIPLQVTVKKQKKKPAITQQGNFIQEQAGREEELLRLKTPKNHHDAPK